MKYTPNGTAVATFSVATSQQWTDQSGEKKESVEWFNCVAWAKLAEVVSQYLGKGSSVYVSGRMQTRNWEDENGAKHWKTELVAEKVVFLDKRGQSADPGPQEPGGYAGPMDDDDLPL